MKIDPRHLSAGVAALGGAALIASGFFTLTTPEAQQCQLEKAKVEAELAAANARLAMLIDVKETSKIALDLCLASP